MISVKYNQWTIISTWYKCIIQFMYHVDSWRMSKKSLTIIVQCVNKVKCYLNFHIHNLKLLKKKMVNSSVSVRCSLWIIIFTYYQTLIQLMLDVNIWKVVK